MRLFIAVRPPEDVLDAIASLSRPEIAGTRWTTREQWHITLRFFGEVHDTEPIVHALQHCALPRARVTIGPRAGMLGRGVVQLPVHGLEVLAADVRDVTAGFGQPESHPRYRGHLTLARTRSRIEVRALALDRTWEPEEVELLRSHLGRGGARYEALQRFSLGGV